MITEALLVANLAMLSVFACRAVQATKAELRLLELELDEQLGIGPIEEDCREAEKKVLRTNDGVWEGNRLVCTKPRKWVGALQRDVVHWVWSRKEWHRIEHMTLVNAGEILVPGRFPKPTEPPPESIEETDDIAWLRGS